MPVYVAFKIDNAESLSTKIFEVFLVRRLFRLLFSFSLYHKTLRQS